MANLILPPRLQLGIALRSKKTGGGNHIGLMSRDQLAVLGRHQVWLDKIGAELDRQRITFQGVVGRYPAAPRWPITSGRR
jgi:hypothetical protein